MPAIQPCGAAIATSQLICALICVILLQAPASAQQRDNTRPAVSGIAQSLTGVPGDRARGRDIALNHDLGNCALCHVLPEPDAPVAGNVGPPLAGVGTRLSAGELRLRLVDSTRINPDSTMPAYHRTEGLTHVATGYRGKPILSAQEIEDVIAYLQGLR